MIIEAPDASHRRSSRVALETFAEAFGLRTRRAVLGFENATQQEIALSLRPPMHLRCATTRSGPKAAVTTRLPRRASTAASRSTSTSTRHLKRVVWSKPPLELSHARSASRVAPFRMIRGCHAKSKAPPPRGVTGPRSGRCLRVRSRTAASTLAQCIWLRRRVEEHLAAADPLIVLGDFNDGPGIDEYEKLFGRSGLEIVLGEADGGRLKDPHADMALQRRLGAMPTTARFYIPSQKRWLEVLLDYIMVSPDLARLNPAWRIWHPFDDPVCYRTPELREALLTASDHFPVTLDIDL